MVSLFEKRGPILWPEIERALTPMCQSDRTRFAFDAMNQHELALTTGIALKMLDPHSRSLVMSELVLDKHLQTARRIIEEPERKMSFLELTVAFEALSRQYPKIKPEKQLPNNFPPLEGAEILEAGGYVDPFASALLLEESMERHDYLTLETTLRVQGYFPRRSFCKGYVELDEKGKLEVNKILSRCNSTVCVNIIFELIASKCDDSAIQELFHQNKDRIKQDELFCLLRGSITFRRLKLGAIIRREIYEKYGRDWPLKVRAELFVECTCAGAYNMAKDMNINRSNLQLQPGQSLEAALSTPGTVHHALLVAIAKAIEARGLEKDDIFDIFTRFVDDETYALMGPEMLRDKEQMAHFLAVSALNRLLAYLLENNDLPVCAVALTVFLLKKDEYRRFLIDLAKELKTLTSSNNSDAFWNDVAEVYMKKVIMTLSIDGVLFTSSGNKMHLTAADTEKLKKALKSLFKKKYYQPHTSYLSNSKQAELPRILAIDNKTVAANMVGALESVCPHPMQKKEIFDRVVSNNERFIALRYASHHLPKFFHNYAAMVFAEKGWVKELEAYLKQKDYDFERHVQVGILFELLKAYSVELKFSSIKPHELPQDWNAECFDTILSPECCAQILEEAAKREDRVVQSLMRRTQVF